MTATQSDRTREYLDGFAAAALAQQDAAEADNAAAEQEAAAAQVEIASLQERLAELDAGLAPALLDAERLATALAKALRDLRDLVKHRSTIRLRLIALGAWGASIPNLWADPLRAERHLSDCLTAVLRDVGSTQQRFGNINWPPVFRKGWQVWTDTSVQRNQPKES